MRLIDFATSLKSFPSDGVFCNGEMYGVIYVPIGGQPSADTEIMIVMERLELREDERDGPYAGWRQFLPLDLCVACVEVWSAWRDGQQPEPAEMCAAMLYYDANDAWMPLDL